VHQEESARWLIVSIVGYVVTRWIASATQTLSRACFWTMSQAISHLLKCLSPIADQSFEAMSFCLPGSGVLVAGVADLADKEASRR
jgi:hypothetical protein